jgi:hypothetical protein
MNRIDPSYPDDEPWNRAIPDSPDQDGDPF